MYRGKNGETVDISEDFPADVPAAAAVHVGERDDHVADVGDHVGFVR